MTIGTMDDSRKRPGSPGLASSTRRRRANDEINAHRMLVAMTGAVVVVASVTSSVTHTMLASDIRRSINERSGRLDWEDHCEDLDERGPDCFKGQYRMPPQTFEKTCRYTASPASTRPPFLRTLLDEMMSCIHQRGCTERESVFYRQFRTPRSPIAQPDSKIPCRYHFQVDYELYSCDVLFSSFKMREVSSFFYSIIFNIADERLNLGKFI